MSEKKQAIKRDSGIAIYWKPSKGRWDVTIPRALLGDARKSRVRRALEEAEAYAEREEKRLEGRDRTYYQSTEAERAEFVRALPRLREAEVGLLEAVDYALPRLRPAQELLTLGEFVEIKRREKEEKMKQDSK